MEINRRNFLHSAAAASAGAVIPQLNIRPRAVKRNKNGKLQVAILGSGFRGQSHIDLLLNRSDCKIVAVADIDPVMISRTKNLFTKKSVAQPKYYSSDEKSYLELIEKEEIDLAIISSPWRWHSEMAIACMKAGIYTGMEVCGAFSLDECWQLVNVSEATNTPLYFMENVCFRRDVMAILNMVKKNMFGEMIHLEGGYQHDLRGVKFNDGVSAYNSGVEFGDNGFSEAKWRTKHSVYRNGDLYPTHGLGPVAQMIDINRGNRFLYISSISSKARGLHDYIVNHDKGGKNHPNAKQRFKLGDKVTSFIKTNNDETIVLHHDTNLPRPYSLGFRVQGSKGLWMSVNKSLHIEGISPSHRWEDAEGYLKKYDHPLWAKHEQKAVGAGHGGMDWFLINSLVEHCKEDLDPPFDVYDAAAWLAVTPLSEESISLGSQPVAFPDFTRGRWTERKGTFGDNHNF